MDLVPYRYADQEVTLQAWNRWFPPTFRVDARLLEQLTWAHPSFAEHRSILAWEGSRLQGFMIARPFGATTIIDAIAVSPDARGQGLGRSLLASLSPGEVRFGGGPAHFVPGLPNDYQDSRPFFDKLGFQKDWLAHDLRLSAPLEECAYRCCSPSDQEAVLAMVRQEFSERWADDTEARFQAGDAGDIVIIPSEDGPHAFCLTWHYQSRLLGPSVFWLRNECDTYGGIGPVGVAQRMRGHGLGGRVVQQALSYLASRGVSQVGVDWTSIGPFYKKYGFQDWRQYDGLKRPAELAR